MTRPHIRRFPDLESLVQAAAEDLVDCLERAIHDTGCCRIAMAGGSTPRPVYRLVATPSFASRIDWRKVDIFWGDERCVPPTDPASNYRMVQEDLLSQVPIPEGNIHRIEAERSPDDSARAYAELLGNRPLDVVLLGMGEDGHTASLFPGMSALDEKELPVAAVPGQDPPRVTLTLPMINSARTVVFIVTGESKAHAVSSAIDGDDKDTLPAGLVKREAAWLLDEAAASALSSL